MPSRIVRDGILTSERVNSLSCASEVFYRRLLSVVDDFGRYYATPMLLRAACYPLQLDKVADADITQWLADCAAARLVSAYPGGDGKRYLQVHDFRQQVRAKDSKFPAPAEQMKDACLASAKQVISTRDASVHLDVDVDVDVDDIRASKPARSSAVSLQAWLGSLDGTDAIPADDPIFTYAETAKIPVKYLELSWRCFCDDQTDRGKKQKDWRAHYRNAVKRNWYKIWWFDANGECQLTTAGKQAERVSS